MKNKIILTGLIVLFLCGCETPKYLPTSDLIDINEYGSYIIIYKIKASSIDGELIAIDSNNIVVLTTLDNKCKYVPVKEVKSFTLRYAKPKNYGWTIPLYITASIFHGYFLVLTMPLNLYVTIFVTASGQNAFVYSNKVMTIDDLKMFARFPQGIPAYIEIVNIK